jgi:glycosyltransferase involved in cell wall biosynthesis
MKIAFCKFAGMANGGTEKYLQNLAVLYKSVGHDIDYFYTNAAPILGTSWIHPDNYPARINEMLSHEINLIPINVGCRDGYYWRDNNFFDKFDEDKYEFLITAGDGSPEYPYTNLNNIKIIHTIHGDSVFNKKNIHKSVLLCDWQANRWINNGGDVNKLSVISPIIEIPKFYKKTFRFDYNIPIDAFVYGMHQRNDDSVSSTAFLEAFMLLNDNDYCVVLGGSNKHREYARTNNIKNVIFVDQTSDTDIIHNFIDSLDVYTHCRLDGEVCSACLIEAIYHGKPIVSYIGINMGHAEQLDGCSKILGSVSDYAKEMYKLKKDDKYRLNMSINLLERYNSRYNFDKIKLQLLGLIS